jgi:hypothetical protein
VKGRDRQPVEARTGVDTGNYQGYSHARVVAGFLIGQPSVVHSTRRDQSRRR